ncbi:MAG: hypothetical protein ABUL60_02175 [Myxococcales bacterium]
MRERRLLKAIGGLAVLACHCRGEPAPSVAPATSLSVPQPQTAAAPVGAPAPALSAPAPSSSTPSPPIPTASAATSAAPVTTSPEAEDPPLLGSDGAPLPQTEARPSASDERFKRRMQRLADAIISGDVEKARSSFFPLVAYAQVKDVAKPERDYRFRLMSNFERDVREYRKALGRDAEHAELIGVDVPEARVEWMKPGKEGNRLGYFRVLRSRLRFRLPDGKERSFELTSLISWRGEWYVVHLHGFE